MKISVPILIALCAGGLMSAAQDCRPFTSSSPSSAHLQMTANTAVPIKGALLGNARCDFDGNIYIRVMDAEASKKDHAELTLPIQRIAPSGKLTGTFKITDASSDLLSMDFAVTGNGRGYQASWSNSDRAVYVVGFSKDGSFK